MLFRSNAAVIGTGSTAAQIVPELAKHAGSVTVYQRTPGWVAPRGDRPVSDNERRFLNWTPGFLSRVRGKMMDLREEEHPGVADPSSKKNEETVQACLDMMHHGREQPPRSCH